MSSNTAGRSDLVEGAGSLLTGDVGLVVGEHLEPAGAPETTHSSAGR